MVKVWNWLIFHSFILFTIALQVCPSVDFCWQFSGIDHLITIPQRATGTITVIHFHTFAGLKLICVGVI